MILVDREIRELCQREPPLITPFLEGSQIRPSAGLSSCGYDLRLGRIFLVPVGGVHYVVDPLSFDKRMFLLHVEEETFELAPHSVVLAETVEWLNMPEDVVGVVLGKSTYARCGLLVNATPAEPGWRGRLTLELANLSPYPIRLYVGRGIAQILFFRIPRPERTYSDRSGLYQDQQGVTPPKA